MDPDTDHLAQVRAAGRILKDLKKMRNLHQQTRDRAAWSLLTHEHWTNPQIRAIFGTSSHDAWTKSRARMRALHPNGAPRVGFAENAVKLAARFINDLDHQITEALPERIQADIAAYQAGHSIASIARAAQVSRQDMHTELINAGVHEVQTRPETDDK